MHQHQVHAERFNPTRERKNGIRFCFTSFRVVIYYSHRVFCNCSTVEETTTSKRDTTTPSLISSIYTARAGKITSDS